MIEMLGVLAIIGVLSVGGITGYSKAMLMYNSNLQKNQLREIFAGMLQIQPNLNFKDAYSNITSVFEALDIIPDGLSYKNNTLYDAFGNDIQIHYGTPAGEFVRYRMAINLAQNNGKNSLEAQQYCLNTLQISKENANVIKMINMFRDNKSWFLQGNRTCVKGDVCLKDMSMVQMHNICNSCSGTQSCYIVLHLWPE